MIINNTIFVQTKKKKKQHLSVVTFKLIPDVVGLFNCLIINRALNIKIWKISKNTVYYDKEKKMLYFLINIVLREICETVQKLETVEVTKRNLLYTQIQRFRWFIFIYEERKRFFSPKQMPYLIKRNYSRLDTKRV